MNLTIVKIGGNVIDDPKKLNSFLDEFVKLPNPKILVHGGGKEATRMSREMGIETKIINGRRITDRETLDIVTMVYSGLINKRIVSQLQAKGCNAIGLSGADGGSIRAKRRNPEPIDFGYVGDIDSEGIGIDTITTLLSAGMTPVFCPLTHDGKGMLLNCNADTIASSIACAMSTSYPTDLIYCFELPGVLSDINNPKSVVPYITPSMRDSLIESGAISGGMIPKIDNAIMAVAKGVDNVIIKPAEELLEKNAGTTIRLRSC